MRIGITTDHGGFSLKRSLSQLHAAGREVVDFGAYSLNPTDDYPDFVCRWRPPLRREGGRGVAFCGSGVGASVCANGFRASAPRSFTTTSRPCKALRTTT
jgi:ribose 5-phosphate isomerase B